MTASFTISEFSELVSAALDGPSDYGLEAPGGGDGDRVRRIHLRNTPSDTPQHTNRKANQFHRNGAQGLVADPTSLFASTSNSRVHPNNPYNNYCNPATKMLIISPPGPGPLPPSVTPILSASMSTVDLSANCLSLGMGHAGCGGTASKSALDAAEPLAEHAMLSVSASATQTNSSSSNPITPRHRPLALLAKIKRQLSKSNVDSGVIYTPENTTPESSRTPPQDRKGGRALVISSSTAGSPNPAVSFAPTPSFYPSSPDALISEDASVAMFPSNDVSAPKRRLRRGSSSDSLVSLSASMTGRSYSYDYGCSDSAFSTYSTESALVAGSLCSYINIGEPSIIGSSASFFAALNRGRDGRTGRRGSELDGESEILEQAGFDGEFGFPDVTADPDGYWDLRHGHSAQALAESEDGRQVGSGTAAPLASYDGEVDTQSVQSYMPYLPLAMQLERKQQGHKTRVSVEDVASLARSRSSLSSRASFAASTSSPSIGRHSTGANSAEMMGLTPLVKSRPRPNSNKYSPPGGKTRRHVPPPLRATPSPSRSSVSSHPYAAAAALQQPYSPTSSASSRSPITPCTPFFTASEASLEGDEEDDSESRITSSAEAAGRMEEYAMNKALGRHISSDTFGQPRLVPSLSNDASARIRVHVLPPTPTILGLVPQYTNIAVRDTSETPSATNLHNDISNSRDDGVIHKRNHSISKSRASRQGYISSKVPPMSPPPSGPLPLPPSASPPSSSEISKTLSIAHHRSLSPQASLEWAPHRHPSPLARTLSRETQFWDENEGVLHTTDGSNVTSTPESKSSASVSFVDHDAGSVFHQSSEGLSGMESTTNTSDFASFVSDSSSTHTSQTHERTRAAVLAANTRANAFDGFFHPSKAEKIGVGRRQVPHRATTANADARGDLEVDREWTLGLGMPPSPEPAMLFPSVSVDAALSGPSSTVRKRMQLASVATPARRLVIPPTAEHATLRDRTMSESALSRSARARQPQMVNEDWTLSLPLPGPATRSPSKNVAAVHESGKAPVIIIVPDTDCSSVQDSSLEAASMDQDELDSVLDLGPRASMASMEVEQVVISVPRVVTAGSGIERASRSRSTSARRQPTVFESEEEDGVFGGTSALANENLAKLDALSADLARFNELLRQGGAQLRRGNEGSASLLVPPTSRGLKHARSCGVLEVDEPPPKNAILRTASFGDLLGAESTAREKPTDDVATGPSVLPPTPVFAFYAPLDDNSPTLPKPEIHQLVADALRPGSSDRPSSSSSSQSVALTASMSTISARNSGTSFNSRRSSAGSTTSTITARAGNLRPRASLPLASPPSAFAYRPAGLHLDETVRADVDPAVRPGLASGSALNLKRSRSKLAAGSAADSGTNPTTEGKFVPPLDDKCPQNDTTSHSPQSTREAPSRSDLPETNDSTPPTSAASSSTTPTKPNLPSLTITTTPTSSPKRPSGARRMSISSVSSEDSAGSSSSLTPTLSPAYDSSADPTPLASYFPAPPASHPLASLFGNTQRAQLAFRTPEKRHALTVVSPSPKAMVPTLEDRIRQLRKLGMDAAMVRNLGTSANSSPTSVGEVKDSANEQVDTDSDAAYYSARSSFSSAR
ncbi:hypothetical protein HYPSUDRAFT_41554 [Hypholoma sublateritium FD-334 SS-4]|uniref:Uncharacterized protein n=1 Tax=Hypholoma sublateritium (strain FD-334 SS-4) TaxID=945553 RepID=A0A0D2L4Y5_HYPSF|nr:hypothetical protein HYPSUDRAFT_41554 [Hypholoma sublateritium FD-334 SS-4]